MKKLFTLLLLTPLFINASAAEFCMQKYSPEKEKDKFIQCVEDILEFKKENINLPADSKVEKKQETYQSDQFNFLDPSALAINNFSQSQKNQVLQIYNDFIQGVENKAFVFSYNVNKFRIGDVYTWCTNEDTIIDANECAITKCELAKSKGEICLVQYENDNYVFAKNREIVKNKYASSNSNNRNQIDWAGAADTLGSLIQNNPAFGSVPTTKVCNFKNFSGQVITGDCSTGSIRSGNDIYWKVK